MSARVTRAFHWTLEKLGSERNWYETNHNGSEEEIQRKVKDVKRYSCVYDCSIRCTISQ